MSADTLTSLRAEVRQHKQTADGLTAHAIYGRQTYACARDLASRLRELDPEHPSLARWDAIKDIGRAAPPNVEGMGQEVLNLGAA